MAVTLTKSDIDRIWREQPFGARPGAPGRPAATWDQRYEPVFRDAREDAMHELAHVRQALERWRERAGAPGAGAQVRRNITRAERLLDRIGGEWAAHWRRDYGALLQQEG